MARSLCMNYQVTLVGSISHESTITSFVPSYSRVQYSHSQLEADRFAVHFLTTRCTYLCFREDAQAAILLLCSLPGRSSAQAS